jgi:hypothetical protein
MHTHLQSCWMHYHFAMIFITGCDGTTVTQSLYFPCLWHSLQLDEYKIHWHWTMYNFLGKVSHICWLIALRYTILGIIRIKPLVTFMRLHNWCRLSCTQRFSACNIEDLISSSSSRPANTKYDINVLGRPYLCCFHCISLSHSFSTNLRRTNFDSSCKRKLA